MSVFKIREGYESIHEGLFGGKKRKEETDKRNAENRAKGQKDAEIRGIKSQIEFSKKEIQDAERRKRELKPGDIGYDGALTKIAKENKRIEELEEKLRKLQG